MNSKMNVIEGQKNKFFLYFADAGWRDDFNDCMNVHGTPYISIDGKEFVHAGEALEAYEKTCMPHVPHSDGNEIKVDFFARSDTEGIKKMLEPIEGLLYSHFGFHYMVYAITSCSGYGRATIVIRGTSFNDGTELVMNRHAITNILCMLGVFGTVHIDGSLLRAMGIFRWAKDGISYETDPMYVFGLFH